MAISVGYHCAATDLARCSGRASGGGELGLECFQLGPCPLPQALHLAHLHHTRTEARSGISDPMIRRSSPLACLPRVRRVGRRPQALCLSTYVPAAGASHRGWAGGAGPGPCPPAGAARMRHHRIAQMTAWPASRRPPASKVGRSTAAPAPTSPASTDLGDVVDERHRLDRRQRLLPHPH